jgi:hypothetical protein
MARKKTSKPRTAQPVRYRLPDDGTSLRRRPAPVEQVVVVESDGEQTDPTLVVVEDGPTPTTNDALEG